MLHRVDQPLPQYEVFDSASFLLSSSPDLAARWLMVLCCVDARKKRTEKSTPFGIIVWISLTFLCIYVLR